MQRTPAVYILTDRPHGRLYVGVTSNLVKRVASHRSLEIDGFTKRFRITQLVHYEVHQTMISAITREKQIKHWKRIWKVELIEESNPMWRDLWDDIVARW